MLNFIHWLLHLDIEKKKDMDDLERKHYQLINKIDKFLPLKDYKKISIEIDGKKYSIQKLCLTRSGRLIKL